MHFLSTSSSLQKQRTAGARFGRPLKPALPSPLNWGSRQSDGFTLLELLISIAIIAILAGLTFPALSGARTKAKRAQCMNNLRQLAMGSLSYANDHENGYLTPQRTPMDQDLNWLQQQLGGVGGSVFVCPSTKNQVRNLRGKSKTGEYGTLDLFDSAWTSGAGFGHSYWLTTFMVLDGPYVSRVSFPGGETTVPYLRKTTETITTHRHLHDAFGLKGTVPGPSRIWLIMDWTMADNNHYPDAADNHSTEGSNIAMTDGHVEWVPARDFVRSYEMSQDDGRTGIPVPN